MIEKPDAETRVLQSVGEPLAFLYRCETVHARIGMSGVVIHAIRQRLGSATLSQAPSVTSPRFFDGLLLQRVGASWSLRPAAGMRPAMPCL